MLIKSSNLLSAFHSAVLLNLDGETVLLCGWFIIVSSAAPSNTDLSQVLLASNCDLLTVSLCGWFMKVSSAKPAPSQVLLASNFDLFTVSLWGWFMNVVSSANADRSQVLLASNRDLLTVSLCGWFIRVSSSAFKERSQAWLSSNLDLFTVSLWPCLIADSFKIDVFFTDLLVRLSLAVDEAAIESSHLESWSRHVSSALAAGFFRFLSTGFGSSIGIWITFFYLI